MQVCHAIYGLTLSLENSENFPSSPLVSRVSPKGVGHLQHTAPRSRWVTSDGGFEHNHNTYRHNEVFSTAVWSRLLRWFDLSNRKGNQPLVLSGGDVFRMCSRGRAADPPASSRAAEVRVCRSTLLSVQCASSWPSLFRSWVCALFQISDGV